MKDEGYIHFIWLLWLIVLSITMINLPATVKVRSGKVVSEYQTVGVLRLGKDPYLVVPVYVANKDMRSWYYMRTADQVIAQGKKLIDLPKGNQDAVS